MLKALPEEKRIGVGVVNQKRTTVENLEGVTAKAERAIALFGVDRVLLNPACGFATFANNPIASTTVAEQKLAVMVRAATLLRERH